MKIDNPPTPDFSRQVNLEHLDDQELLEYRDMLRMYASRGVEAAQEELKRADAEVTRRWEALEATDRFINNQGGY